MKNTGNLIVDLTYQFALDIAAYTDSLEQIKKFAMANQLFKSGTSIGANTREAQHPESRADFIHKFKIAMKEVEETDFWLSICRDSDCFPNPPEKLFKDLVSIQKVIGKILSSSYGNGDN